MHTALFLSLAFLCKEYPISVEEGGLTAVKQIVNLGEIRDPRAIGYNFQLKNSSPKDILRITQVVSPCGCTKTKITKNNLKPNEECELQIVIHPLTQPEGEHTWKLNVKYSNGLKDFELPLIIQVKIKKEIVIEPTTLIMIGSQALNSKIRVIDRRMIPLKVTGVSSGIPESSYQIDSATNTIEIHISSKCPFGSYEDDLVIKTNDPTYPELRLPIKVIRRKEVTTEAIPDTPELIFRGDDDEATVLVRIRGLNPVKISEVIPNQNFLKCKYVNGPGTQATLRITIHRRDVSKSDTGEILVKFMDEKEPPLIIPVTWIKPSASK